MRKALLILCLISASWVYATQDLYTFKDPADQARFMALTTELRCLVCQNQNLAESNAGLANDLRGQIYQQILQGESNPAIIDYLVARYGDFILYNPPLNWVTLGLWFGPFLVLITGISVLYWYLKRSRQ